MPFGAPGEQRFAREKRKERRKERREERKRKEPV